jgi:hypothetical protein
MTTQLSLKQARQMFNIYPRSQKALTAWELANILSVPHEVKIAAQGIEWALKTGRLTGSVEIAIRQMSIYQTLKVLVDVVNNTETISEVPSWLNQNIQG